VSVQEPLSKFSFNGKPKGSACVLAAAAFGLPLND